MRIVLATIAASIALPFMALGQTQSTEPQQQDATTATQSKGSAEGTKTTAPVKGKREVETKESTNAKANVETHTDTNVKGKAGVRTHEKDAAAGDMNRSETNVRSNSTTTNEHTNTKVNVQEFKTRHAEVFSLGRHPKEFFVQRFGASHVRLIGNTYFAFVDGCWVAVDVDGFTYTERVICEGDPEYIVVE